MHCGIWCVDVLSWHDQRQWVTCWNECFPCWEFQCRQIEIWQYFLQFFLRYLKNYLTNRLVCMHLNVETKYGSEDFFFLKLDFLDLFSALDTYWISWVGVGWRWVTHLLMYTCMNIFFKNIPCKQVLAFSRKTPINKDFTLFHIKFCPLNLPEKQTNTNKQNKNRNNNKNKNKQKQQQKHPFLLKINVFRSLNAKCTLCVLLEKRPLFQVFFFLMHVYTNVSEYPPDYFQLNPNEKLISLTLW